MAAMNSDANMATALATPAPPASDGEEEDAMTGLRNLVMAMQDKMQTMKATGETKFISMDKKNEALEEAMTAETERNKKSINEMKENIQKLEEGLIVIRAETQQIKVEIEEQSKNEKDGSGHHKKMDIKGFDFKSSPNT